jgi:hypothetical protein
MRKTTLAMLLILVSVVLGLSQTEAEWIKFTSPEKYFSVLLPGKPTLEVVTEPVKHNRYILYDKRYSFVIEYVENIGAKDPEAYLDSARDDIANAIKGKLTRENKITSDGYVGRQLEFSHPTRYDVELYSKVRIYYVKGTLFSMAYLWTGDRASTTAAQIGEKYFSSIKIN